MMRISKVHLLSFLFLLSAGSGNAEPSPSPPPAPENCCEPSLGCSYGEGACSSHGYTGCGAGQYEMGRSYCPGPCSLVCSACADCPAGWHKGAGCKTADTAWLGLGFYDSLATSCTACPPGKISTGLVGQETEDRACKDPPPPCPMRDQATGSIIPVHFPGSILVDVADGDKITKWIAEGDASQNPEQVWARCYSKSVDYGQGSFTYESENFHDKCDGLGPTVTVAKLSTGKVVGGYAGVSWASSGRYTSSPTNCVFSLSNGFRHALIAGQEDRAQYNHDYYGPRFGGGLRLDNDMNSGYCNIGNAYPAGYKCRVGADTWVNRCTTGDCACQKDLCGKRYGWTVGELEVWHHVGATRVKCPPGTVPNVDATDCETTDI